MLVRRHERRADVCMLIGLREIRAGVCMLVRRHERRGGVCTLIGLHERRAEVCMLVRLCETRAGVCMLIGLRERRAEIWGTDKRVLPDYPGPSSDITHTDTRAC